MSRAQVGAIVFALLAIAHGGDWLTSVYTASAVIALLLDVRNDSRTAKEKR